MIKDGAEEGMQFSGWDAVRATVQSGADDVLSALEEMPMHRPS